MPTYPALLELASQTLHPLGVSESFLVGRNETADICLLDPTCSRHHFRLVRQTENYYVEPLSPRNSTFLDGRPIVKPELLEHSALIQAGKLRFRFLLHVADPTTARKAAEVTTALPVPQAGQSEWALVEADPEGTMSFPLLSDTLIGREKEHVQVHLPHPQVSRRHARIVLQDNTATLTDQASANGTFINGQRVQAAVVLRTGDHLDIGPYALQFTGTTLVPRQRSDNVELVARGVTRVVTNRETGQPLTLLDDISLVIRPREFVCLLGPSGSGKSTLLSALSGRAIPNAGVVQVNARDLYANFEAIKQDIAVVPQKDVLHESLPVGKALWYTAKLRLPPDTSPAEIEESLSRMLETVGLTTRRATVIRHLSGGQVKRASLANEILCKPSLIFLDEVTSGLDEQTDREVMNLFRSLADVGKTVVCITHSLANVERTCHLVVILTAGGKLAFVGKPAEALKHFGIERLGDVYERLAEKSAEFWRDAFQETPFWKRYVVDRLPIESQGRQPEASTPNQRPADFFELLLRQTILVTKRYAAIWQGDYLALLAMVGQAVVVALLLGLLFGDLDKLTQPADRAGRSVSLLFLLAVSSYWFGCNNAAKEIVKERVIFRRERDFNLRIESYFISKLLVLTAFSWLQTVVLFAIVRAWCAPPGSLVGELVILLTLASTGVALGLAISALAATEEMAITLIPMAVIPQIILSGAISPLQGWSERLALLGVSTYWGKRGLDACLPEAIAAAVPPLGLEQHSTGVAVLILLIHAAVCTAVSLGALHWQNRRR